VTAFEDLGDVKWISVSLAKASATENLGY